MIHEDANVDQASDEYELAESEESRRTRRLLVEPTPAEPEETPDLPPRRFALRLQRAALWLIVTNVVLAALFGGLWLRKWLWVTTGIAPNAIRFEFDIRNGYKWGDQIMREASRRASAASTPDYSHRGTEWRFWWPAYVGLYDTVVAQHPDGNYQLDYTPTRLLIMSLWVRHMRVVYPKVTEWAPQYDFTAPLLRLNNACESAAAIAMFLLVRHWVRRGQGLALHPKVARALLLSNSNTNGHSRRGKRSRDPAVASLSPFDPAFWWHARGWVLGLIAALLVWFNPAILVDAHIWTQWEVWLLPFFLFAAYFASVDWWFAAGLMLPVGIMMKGQLTMVAGLFILWPLFELRPMAALRCVAGFLFSAAIILAPWLAGSYKSWIWIGALLGLSGAAMVALRIKKPNRLSRGAIATWLAAVFALAVFSGAALFHGSFAWHTIGFDYPTHHWNYLSLPNASNLAAIMAGFGWMLGDPVFTFHIPVSGRALEVTIKPFLAGLYALTLVLCSAAAAYKSRRNDTSFLVVLCAPWVLMFALLPMMHERYLLWAGVVTAAMAGVSLGMTLLHVVIVALSTCMISATLIGWSSQKDFAPALVRFMQGTYPASAYAVLLCAGIFLYLALAPGRRLRQPVP